jgi:hypothetical protein
MDMNLILELLLLNNLDVEFALYFRPICKKTLSLTDHYINKIYSDIKERTPKKSIFDYSDGYKVRVYLSYFLSGGIQIIKNVDQSKSVKINWFKVNNYEDIMMYKKIHSKNIDYQEFAINSEYQNDAWFKFNKKHIFCDKCIEINKCEDCVKIINIQSEYGCLILDFIDFSLEINNSLVNYIKREKHLNNNFTKLWMIQKIPKDVYNNKLFSVGPHGVKINWPAYLCYLFSKKDFHDKDILINLFNEIQNKSNEKPVEYYKNILAEYTTFDY